MEVGEGAAEGEVARGVGEVGAVGLVDDEGARPLLAEVLLDAAAVAQEVLGGVVAVVAEGVDAGDGRDA
jgi:hypothetical protein